MLVAVGVPAAGKRDLYAVAHLPGVRQVQADHVPGTEKMSSLKSLPSPREGPRSTPRAPGSSNSVKRPRLGEKQGAHKIARMV